MVGDDFCFDNYFDGEEDDAHHDDSSLYWIVMVTERGNKCCGGFDVAVCLPRFLFWLLP